MINASDRQNNPLNVLRNMSGTKRIFLDIRENPQRVYLNSDAPGNAVMARLMYCICNTADGFPYFQIDFGDGVHSEVNQVFGARSTCIQIPSQTSRLKIPLKFKSNHVPQYMTVTLYQPGENAPLLNLAEHGCQIWIEYEFVPL